MLKITKKKLAIGMTTVLTLIPSINSAHANCEVGSIMFRDTLFGAAIGAGVGALVLIANQNSDRIAANIATSTLIGAGVGAVVGVAEISLSDCGGGSKHGYNRVKPGFSAQPLVTYTNPNVYQEPFAPTVPKNKFSVEDLNQMGMGLNVSYTFDN